MPRVVLGFEIGDWVAKKIRASGFKRYQVAEQMGITPSNLSHKIKRNSFSYKDMVKIFSIVGATDTEIVMVMRHRF